MPALPPLPTLPAIQARGNPCRDLGCSACCHDIEMILTEADLARLRAFRPGEDFWFQADDGYLQLRTRDAPAAAGGAGRPCWFLAPDGTCGAFDARPEGCRLYPAVWDDALRGAELDGDYCPNTGRFVLAPATVDAVRRLARKLQDELAARTAGTAQATRPPGRSQGEPV